MRPAIILFAWAWAWASACSSSPQPAPRPRPSPLAPAPPATSEPGHGLAGDAAQANSSVDAMPEPADPAPRDAAPGFVYDWEAGRKQLEARRRRPAKAGCEDGRRHSEHDECYPTRTPLAARGSATGPEGADWIDLSLDIGTDDGVSPQHRAALLDDHGSPITSFERVEQIAARRCRVRLPGSEIARHVALHLVVMTDPPRR